MGNSSTARYSDGQAIHGAAAAWPTALRERWPTVVGTLLHDLGGQPTAAALARVAPADLKAVLRSAEARASLEGLARRHRVDEADVARLWTGAKTASARRVQALIALEDRVRKVAGRLGATTRAQLRTQIVAALATAPPPDRPVGQWWSTEEGRRVANRALTIGGRRERLGSST